MRPVCPSAAARNRAGIHSAPEAYEPTSSPRPAPPPPRQYRCPRCARAERYEVRRIRGPCTTRGHGIAGKQLWRRLGFRELMSFRDPAQCARAASPVAPFATTVTTLEWRRRKRGRTPCRERRGRSWYTATVHSLYLVVRFVQQRQVQPDPQQEQRHHRQRQMQAQQQQLRKPGDVNQTEAQVNREHRHREQDEHQTHDARTPVLRGEPQGRTDQPARRRRGQRHRHSPDARLHEQALRGVCSPDPWRTAGPTGSGSRPR